MNVLNWLARHFLGRFSSRGKALSLYQRGMAKAKKRDHQGAIGDYTQALDMPYAPADVKAMLFYNRALVYVAAGDHQKGVEDLDVILAMNKAPANIKTMAKQKLARMDAPSNKCNV